MRKSEKMKNIYAQMNFKNYFNFQILLPCFHETFYPIGELVTVI